MKMLVKGEAKTAPEKEIFFWLEQGNNGVIVKAQLGERGWPWNILRFNTDGTVTRFGFISSELGLSLDSLQRVNIS